MIAEYAAIAGAPSPDTPWPLVLDIAQRSAQFEARRKLTAMEATSNAIGGALGGTDGGRELTKESERLQKIAYPGARVPDRFLPNGFATEASDG